MTGVADKTKTEDGKELSASDHAFVGDPDDTSTWKLRVDDKPHAQAALSRFNQTDLPADKKLAVARKVAAKAKSFGIDTSGFEKANCGTEHGEAPRPWIEIFRAGDYGAKGNITPADLQRVVRNYDPTYHEAPATIGHPADDKPAYAWIDGLMVDGDKLLAREKQADPKFDEARKAGKFKKRSAAFYCDADGNVTGLRHVAWLGAMPPEVKGLQDVAFDDHGSKFITVDFGEDGQVAAGEKTFAEQFKETFAALLGLGSAPNAPRTFSEADVTRIANEAAVAATKPLQTEITSLQTKLTAQQTEFTEREKQLAGGEVKQRAVAAAARLKTAGKWVPAFERQGLSLVFDELAKVTTTIEFGEGDAKKKVTPLETLVLFLEGLPKIVPDGRMTLGAVPGARGNKSTGDPLTDAARARQKEKNITFAEALAQVAEEQPELTVAGASAGGAV